ncbi:hypothetical protein SODALDRAFT_321417 [Sodiomyces alkalinus F11]|uniref:Uncharacterized protein n=1 Tax=Sodiomyces alkalinus (strain CBS 110278 / VKM F-3762 / F11) TaxID=1314773 RepID=A0A3N2PJZ9_SODAK|nr:hypothetical protein SODALDRAFT_321417 [Sodiomyces alkalinus F11]ROT34760.1 hypothetical protein SODALDRAFT_321417 [Sodiomyces alkalinus F11]
MGTFASAGERPLATDQRAAVEDPAAVEPATDETVADDVTDAEDAAPSIAGAQDAAPSGAPPNVRKFAEISDHRPTHILATRPVLHNTIHLRKSHLATWLGIGADELRILAMSGPVLKHIPAAHAVLIFPDSKPTAPCDGETETCIYALGILFRENVRAQLPSSLDAVMAHHRIPNITAQTIRDAPHIGPGPKRRGQILASLVLSLLGDLKTAQTMTPQDYDSLFSPHVARLERANPWGADAYKCHAIPHGAIQWPSWDPASRPELPCPLHAGPRRPARAQEHEVETYHRVLSTLRYALREHEPKRYYSRRGFGHDLRHGTDAQFVYGRLMTVQREMREKALADRARDRAEGRELEEDRHVRELAARFPDDNALQILNWMVDRDEQREKNQRQGGG